VRFASSLRSRLWQYRFRYENLGACNRFAHHVWSIEHRNNLVSSANMFGNICSGLTPFRMGHGIFGFWCTTGRILCVCKAEAKTWRLPFVTSPTVLSTPRVRPIKLPILGAHDQRPVFQWRWSRPLKCPEHRDAILDRTTLLVAPFSGEQSKGSSVDHSPSPPQPDPSERA